ncbi:uncharacterized protein LOC130359485 isoform X1 [Hyla sarda]|uniref:uncharacterized protein LOC130359485 isoform X1 n=1 Tax=Hyla sarda TaxID=327740 RepID=UPI0024C39196|nr:uncharacterized protein LOC130359485 isoform X1 [Hyla sarda]XP_056418832.1 uncharacterized protein LOC130359485 isoform X1 [Hyla sarda]XP_056418833.1 uncharacterized protein LOC130359485 isoform X1 [Hyla sarda]XP_056418834.1 uncharacterized protein LOC130359485 isoform X1 [Hyla sarda]
MARFSLYHNANFQSFVRPDYVFKPVKEKYDEIREEAKLKHIHEARTKEKSATVYAGEYRGKELDKTCQSSMRPSSPTRMNKPHPPDVFLVTTLHNIPGHYNCKNKISSGKKGKEKTNDSSTSRPQKIHCDNKSQVHIFNDMNYNMAAQAWLKVANDGDYAAVVKMIKFVSDKQVMKKDICAKNNTSYQVLKQYLKPEYIPSAQCWLQNAPPEETIAVERLLRTLSTGPHTTDLKETSAAYSPIYRQKRTEYLIHPDWRAQS